jgi:hypothetical protein
LLALGGASLLLTARELQGEFATRAAISRLDAAGESQAAEELSGLRSISARRLRRNSSALQIAILHVAGRSRIGLGAGFGYLNSFSSELAKLLIYVGGFDIELLVRLLEDAKVGPLAAFALLSLGCDNLIPPISHETSCALPMAPDADVGLSLVDANSGLPPDLHLVRVGHEMFLSSNTDTDRIADLGSIAPESASFLPLGDPLWNLTSQEAHAVLARTPSLTPNRESHMAVARSGHCYVCYFTAHLQAPLSASGFAIVQVVSITSTARLTSRVFPRPAQRTHTH